MNYRRGQIRRSDRIFFSDAFEQQWFATVKSVSTDGVSIDLDSATPYGDTIETLYEFYVPYRLIISRLSKDDTLDIIDALNVLEKL